MIVVGKISESISKFLERSVSGTIYQSEGLVTHVKAHHAECVQYINLIPEIIRSPDFIGRSPKENSTSFELVKCLTENIQIGVKFDKQHNYFYVATLYTVTNAKLSARIKSGRLKKIC